MSFVKRASPSTAARSSRLPAVHRRHGPPAQPSQRARQLSRQLPQAERVAGRKAAWRFLVGYLRVLQGRRSADAPCCIAPELRDLLGGEPLRATPGQRKARPAIRRLGVTAEGPGRARAVAIVQDAGGPPYTLLLYLELHGSRWLVTRIGDA